LSERVLEGLNDEASLQKISANALVNKILSDYVEFERLLERFGVVRVGKATIREVLDAVAEDNLVKAGLNAGRSFPLSIISAKYGKIGADSVTRFMREYFTYSNLVHYSEMRQNGVLVITLAHGLGLKVSSFLEAYMQPVLKLAGLRVKHSLKTPEAIVITLQYSQTALESDLRSPVETQSPT